MVRMDLEQEIPFVSLRRGLFFRLWRPWGAVDGGVGVAAVRADHANSSADNELMTLNRIDVIESNR